MQFFFKIGAKKFRPKSLNPSYLNLFLDLRLSLNAALVPCYFSTIHTLPTRSNQRQVQSYSIQFAFAFYFDRIWNFQSSFRASHSSQINYSGHNISTDFQTDSYRPRPGKSDGQWNPFLKGALRRILFKSNEILLQKLTLNKFRYCIKISIFSYIFISMLRMASERYFRWTMTSS